MNEIIRDSRGNVIGRLVQDGASIRVYGSNGVLLGYTMGGKTYDSSNRVIASTEAPMLLLR